MNLSRIRYISEHMLARITRKAESNYLESNDFRIELRGFMKIHKVSVRELARCSTITESRVRDFLDAEGLPKPDEIVVLGRCFDTGALYWMQQMRSFCGRLIYDVISGELQRTSPKILPEDFSNFVVTDGRTDSLCDIMRWSGLTLSQIALQLGIHSFDLKDILAQKYLFTLENKVRITHVFGVAGEFATKAIMDAQETRLFEELELTMLHRLSLVERVVIPQAHTPPQ